jgi:hypothetical protein
MRVFIHLDAKVDDTIFKQAVGAGQHHLYHSPARISYDFETAIDQAAFYVSKDHRSHYVDWNVFSETLPKVLDEQDSDKPLRSKALFARKFDEGRSGGLIAMLENALASRAPVP